MTLKIMIYDSNAHNELQPPQKGRVRFIETKCLNFHEGQFGEYRACREDLCHLNNKGEELWSKICNIRLYENGTVEGCRYIGKPEEAKVRKDIWRHFLTELEIKEVLPQKELEKIGSDGKLFDYLVKLSKEDLQKLIT